MGPQFRAVSIALALVACSSDHSPSVAPRAPSQVLRDVANTSTWNVIDLGLDPAYFGAVAAAINDYGLIAGYSYQAFQPPQTFLQRGRGKRQYLSPLQGDSGSFPVAINNTGLVVGLSQRGQFGPFSPVYWDQEGAIRPIPAGTPAQPTAVSNTGWIVGYGGVGAWRWRRNGSLQLLPGDARFPFARAFGVNDAGYVVGEASGPVLWDPAGNIERLPMPLGAVNGHAVEISNRGDIVGYYFMADNSVVAFTWSRAQGLKLLPHPAGTTNAWATDVDRHGRVFGYASAQGTGFNPYVWVAGVPMPLPQFSLHSFLTDANDCGVGVGTGAVGSNVHALAWLTEC